ncbi:S41 family peptidase [Anaerostipes sp.]|uniref:S41 family peptidase n=1 Tax=Anaerostipes sp. TaxID=1872530 RepID=UPI002582BE5F|nr:S41 family peptidase [Anaerostipes sp.]MCI5623776.1 S41 family peptidase [Anaerostipes sp.]
MKKLSKIIVGILVVTCIAEGFFLYRAYAIPSDTLKTAQKINKIEKTIEKYYKGKIDKEQLEDYTYKGLVAGLEDPYSDYYSKEDFEDLMESTNGVYSGVGIYMTQNLTSGIITVVKTIKGSPSDGSGLKKGDILTKVDDHDVTADEELSEVVDRIKGKEGTEVTLYFLRGSKTMKYTFTRKSIETPTVETRMLDNGIGYLSISEFDEVTVKQFEDGMKKLKKQGMKSLIIDLRDNPGGLLNAVVDIADDLLPKGKIVYTEDKNGKKKTYNAEDDDQLNMPLCLLVNENSASASEILAGAIKDRNAGTLVGEKTFGKGIVQGFFDLGDDSYVKLTYSSYYTPAGHNIHKKGIQPNVSVKDNEKTKQDEQLQKAVDILSKK